MSPSSPAVSPSLPSDGGEGWGEEARFHLGNQQPPNDAPSRTELTTIPPLLGGEGRGEGGLFLLSRFTGAKRQAAAKLLAPSFYESIIHSCGRATVEVFGNHREFELLVTRHVPCAFGKVGSRAFPV